jgi:hypothetical protein
VSVAVVTVSPRCAHDAVDMDRRRDVLRLRSPQAQPLRSLSLSPRACSARHLI